ncbi:MAG: hypothetical protein HY787_00460 [Deltaproteobacteria bacterium]|nr:hypothetical protein [Deltaproteobacteria bacterium]
MKSKKSERMNDLVQAIGEHVEARKLLARQAEQQYAFEVEAILKAQSRDPQRIEHLLDGMLDFCFDPQMLFLYKKLCRYYFKIDPEATASYVHAYRDMWDEKVGDLNHAESNQPNGQ